MSLELPVTRGKDSLGPFCIISLFNVAEMEMLQEALCKWKAGRGKVNWSFERCRQWWRDEVLGQSYQDDMHAHSSACCSCVH